MPYGAEALKWLTHNKNPSALAANYFQTTQIAIQAVKKLYEAGAIKVEVWVGFDEPWRTERYGGHYANALFVYGPPGPSETRMKLTEAVRSFYIPPEEDPEAGPGQGPEYQLY